MFSYKLLTFSYLVFLRAEANAYDVLPLAYGTREADVKGASRLLAAFRVWARERSVAFQLPVHAALVDGERASF